MKKRESHRSEYSIHALNDVERKVDAQDIIGCWHRGRQWEERRDGSRLGEPELVGGVDSPFGVLWRSIMSFHLRAEIGERSYLFIRETGCLVLSALLDAPRAATGNGLDNDTLITQAALDDLAAGSIDDKVVGVDRAGDNSLSQTGTGIDDGLAAFAGQGVGREKDTSDRGSDHALNSNREVHIVGVDGVAGAVAHCAVGPERGPAATDSINERVLAKDIEIGVLLTGEARVGQIFSRGRGTHGNRDAVSQRAIGRDDGLRDIGWNGCCQQPLSRS